MNRPWYMLKNVTPMSWMIIMSDFIHNFVDGLAIGASFSSSNSIGISTTIAVMCHEIPHQLGNYAILVKCGFLHVQAVLEKVVSGVFAFIGFYTAASISTSTSHTTQWIFAVTAGMFYYISLVDLLPLLLTHKDWRLGDFLFVNLFILLGFGIMVLLTVFEGTIQIWRHLLNLICH